MSEEMPGRLPEFESEDELRDWFDAADLSGYELDAALGVMVSAHIELAVGDDPPGAGTTTRGAIGTLREPVRLVTGQLAGRTIT